MLPRRLSRGSSDRDSARDSRSCCRSAGNKTDLRNTAAACMASAKPSKHPKFNAIMARASPCHHLKQKRASCHLVTKVRSQHKQCALQTPQRSVLLWHPTAGQFHLNHLRQASCGNLYCCTKRRSRLLQYGQCSWPCTLPDFHHTLGQCCHVRRLQAEDDAHLSAMQPGKHDCHVQCR